MSNVPKLRFKEFDGDWEDKRLFTLSENGFSNGAFNDPKKVGSGYKIINVKDMYIDGTINTDSLTKVALEEKEFLKNRVEYGDIFFTRSSLVKEGIAYSNINLTTNEDLTFDGHLIRMRPKKEICSPIFLYYNFTTKRVRNQLIVRGKTTTMTTIGQEDIASVNISLPSKSEQEKTASFLTSVDTKIEQLTKKEALLQEYKKGVMSKIFNQEIRFKDDDGSEFPEWEENTLGDTCKLQGGYAFRSEKFSQKGIPVIRISNISNKNNYIDEKNIVCYEEISNDKNFTIKKGDLIVAMSGATTGKSSIYNLDKKAYINQRVGLFRVNENKLNYGFLIQFVLSKFFSKQLDGVLVAGAQPNISSKDIENFILNLPSLKEQTKIANFLSSIDKKIDLTTKELNSTKEFKKALLQQMFV